MIQNLKTDIIYYRADTDFELEFNLCGCCRMRLLTDKTDSRNGYAECLSRAVSRSRIVISCGSLFGEKNLMETASVLLGIDLAGIDNAKYGIKSEEEIKVLKGSTPLVTSEGIFGGCIIEKNSQTIIILTDSKPVRKRIMSELIHPYISQVSVLAVSQGKHEANEVEKEELFKEENTAEQNPEETVTQNESEENYEDEIPFVFSNEEAEEENEVIPQIQNAEAEEFIGVEFDRESIKEKEKSYIAVGEKEAEAYVGSSDEEADEDSYFSTKEDLSNYNFGEGVQKKKSGVKGVIIVFIIIVLLLISALAYLVLIKPILSGYDISDYIKNLLSPKPSMGVFVNFLR